MISSGCPAMVVAWDGISATLFSLLLTKLFYFGCDVWQLKQIFSSTLFLKLVIDFHRLQNSPLSVTASTAGTRCDINNVVCKHGTSDI